jgi:hypothetical protein
MSPQSEQRRAEARLTRLLNDEEYGPKLVRLSRTDERTVLDLIEANRGRAARKKLIELDEARRHRERVTSRVRRYVAKAVRSGPARPTNEETAFWDRYRLAMGYR